LAAYCGDVVAAQDALIDGADPDYAIKHLFASGNKQRAQYLISYGVDPEKGLMRAIIEGQDELGVLFIDIPPTFRVALLIRTKRCLF